MASIALKAIQALIKAAKGAPKKTGALPELRELHHQLLKKKYGALPGQATGPPNINQVRARRGPEDKFIADDRERFVDMSAITEPKRNWPVMLSKEDEARLLEFKRAERERYRQGRQARIAEREQEAANRHPYRTQHQPAGGLADDDSIRLDELRSNIKGERAGYPVYAPGPRFVDDEYGIANRESYNILKAVRGDPDAEVTIYRAVPNEESITTINPGDWVTLSPKYAELHALSGYGRSGDEPGKILSQKVKVRDIYWDGNDVNEFGFFPPIN